MIERIIGTLPEEWRGLAEIAAAPISWIPWLQQVLIAFFLSSSSIWSAAAKYVFLVCPVLLGLAAIWCTALAVYTLPLRSKRTRFASLFLLAWWDAARMVWMYWVGIARFVAVAVGWVLALVFLAVRLVVGLVRDLLAAPLAMSSTLTRGYLRPGVPWLAFAMLVVWCALEAAVFTYTLQPRVGQYVAELARADEVSRFTGPILYLLLLMLVMGSFVCVQALVDALRRQDNKVLAQMTLVELFVMFFEVVFLYRGLVELVMPWVAEQTAFTLLTAAFGWIGVRGLTWFLFAQYGTPPLLALIARQPIAQLEAPPALGSEPVARWRLALDDFERDIDWLHEKADQALELLGLPVLDVLGAMLNFGMLLIAARPVFSLPFESLTEVTQTRDLEATLQLEPRKQASM